MEFSFLSLLNSCFQGFLLDLSKPEITGQNSNQFVRCRETGREIGHGGKSDGQVSYNTLKTDKTTFSQISALLRTVALFGEDYDPFDSLCSNSQVGSRSHVLLLPTQY